MLQWRTRVGSIQAGWWGWTTIKRKTLRGIPCKAPYLAIQRECCSISINIHQYYNNTATVSLWMLLQIKTPRKRRVKHHQFAPVVGSLSPHRVQRMLLQLVILVDGDSIIDNSEYIYIYWVVQPHCHQTTRVLNIAQASWARNDESEAALQATTTRQ